MKGLSGSHRLLSSSPQNGIQPVPQGQPLMDFQEHKHLNLMLLPLNDTLFRLRFQKQL